MQRIKREIDHTLRLLGPGFCLPSTIQSIVALPTPSTTILSVRHLIGSRSRSSIQSAVEWHLDLRSSRAQDEHTIKSSPLDPPRPRAMRAAFIKPAKARSLSVQIDKDITTVTGNTKTTPSSPPPVAPTRSSSLSHRENKRPYRSMLDVERAPKIGSLKVMSYDELHEDVMPLSNSQAPRFCNCSQANLLYLIV